MSPPLLEDPSCFLAHYKHDMQINKRRRLCVGRPAGFILDEGGTYTEYEFPQELRSHSFSLAFRRPLLSGSLPSRGSRESPDKNINMSCLNSLFLDIYVWGGIGALQNAKWVPKAGCLDGLSLTKGRWLVITMYSGGRQYQKYADIILKYLKWSGSLQTQIWCRPSSAG